MTLTSTPGNTSPIETVSVGAPSDCAPAHQMGDAEILQHVKDCGRHMLACYERYEAFGDPADREAAQHWLREQNAAQAALSPAAKAAREAEIQRQIDNGVDFFAVAGQRDRMALQGRAA